MTLSHGKSIDLQGRAQKAMPLDVNSNFRYRREGITSYVKKDKGGYLWDVDVNRYIDYRMAFDPIILGHTYPEVGSRVHEEIENGVLFAMNSELEANVMENIVRMCPAVEMARLACSGTEAAMYDPREPWFLAYSHSGQDIDFTLNLMQDVVKLVKSSSI